MPEAPRLRTVPLALLAGLVVLSIAFRWPALVNSGTVDSDAAIVGLQARHFLHGEWSWFLYGSGYQTSVDSVVAAAFFLVFGASSVALVLSTLSGHIVATGLAFATLTRRLGAPAAAVAVLPLVFTSSPLHTYILNPPRQAALTLTFVAVFLLDGAAYADERRAAGVARGGVAPAVIRFAGAAVASLACFADPYALLLLPPLLLVGLSTGRVFTTLAGALLGIVPFLVLLASARSVHGETTLTLDVLRHNTSLLLDPCLPWLLGMTAFVPHALLGYSAWEPGTLFHAVQGLGGVLFLIVIASGAAFALSPRARVAGSVRRLGAFGFVVAVLTVASFLVSVMVMDLFSSRYLAALVLFSPFALAPFAARVGWRRLLVTLAPYLLAAGVSGWVGFGDDVRGAAVVTLPGHGARDENDLRALLEARGVHAAVADYWVSYRLTFLYNEAMVVVPFHAREDRYAPYRQAYRAAQRSAYVFDPKRSREDLEAMQREAFAGEAPWGKPVETLRAGDLVAVVFDKDPGGPP